MATPNPIYLPQSEDLQRALFGHTLLNEKAFIDLSTTMDVVGNFRWISPYYTKLWDALVKHKARLNRYPSALEVKNAPEVLNEEPKVRERLELELKLALEATKEMAYDGLILQLRHWQEAVIIDRRVQEMARFYNQGDLPKACEIFRQGARELDRIDSDSGGFTAAPRRSASEKAIRLELASKSLRYGVPFLDEATGGIAPNDLVIIGAKTGRGKTSITTRIATVNSLSGKKVAFFALEAAKGEIERRLKFEMLCDEAEKKGANRENLSFADWMLGKLEGILGPYEDLVQERFEKWFSGLSTFYREGGNFGINELEREVTRAAQFADMIILDHIHYIDTGKEENADVKRIVKKLSDLSNLWNIPIVAVAHLRKHAGGSNHALCPAEDEIHGSSDISKIATTIITFAPVHEFEVEVGSPRETGWPTFFRIAKCRLEGERTRYAAISFYQRNANKYAKSYALGELHKGDTEWRPVSVARRPYWAKNGTVMVGYAE